VRGGGETGGRERGRGGETEERATHVPSSADQLVSPLELSIAFVGFEQLL
jgi:hypothetical protein